MFSIKAFLLAVISVSTIFGQSIGEWHNYTNNEKIMDVALSENGFWIASTGGASYFSNSVNDFTEHLSKSDGLSNQDLTALQIDSNGRIWFGMSNGIIDIYSPEDGSISSILDIFTSNNTNKTINDIQIANDTVYVATDFGLSLIDANTFGFISTTLKFGDFPSSQKVNSVNIHGKIYVSTQNGIAIQKDGATNLLAPDSWQTYSAGKDISANNVYNSVIFNSSLIAGTSSGLFKFENNVWTHLLYSTAIKDISLFNDKMLVLLQSSLNLTDGITSSTLYQESGKVLNKFDANDLEIVIGTDVGVIKIVNDSSSTLLPNGPVNNSFESITVDDNGTLWVGTGKDQFGKGFMKLSDDFWTNFNTTTFPELPNNNYHKVNSRGNQVYLSNWGAGLTIEEDDKFTFYNSSNSELIGIPEAPSYVVIMNCDKDSNGDLWIFNHASADDKPIIQLTHDSLWYHYRFPFFKLSTDVFMTDGIVDLNNTKWFTVSGRGLFYFNENNTPDDESDDIWGWIRTANGLNSDEVHAIAIDNRGELWIGTDKGMNILANTASPKSLITSVFSLRQQSITSITVDPLNNKWVGTHQGLFEMNSDGSQLIAQYDSKNSPLPSDDIKSTAIDKKSGKVFIGTSFGLSTLTTVSAEPNTDLEKVFTYPSPFNLSKNSFLTIDGLIHNSSLKILSISGELIRELDTPGGRLAFWNGKDKNGNFVPSGIYLLVVYSEEADMITTSKIAVIR